MRHGRPNLEYPSLCFSLNGGWTRATSSEGVDVNVMSVLDLQSRGIAPTVAVHRLVCLGLRLNPASGNPRMAKDAMNLATIDDRRRFSRKWEMRDGLRQMAPMWGI
jgi:hypothetical protein